MRNLLRKTALLALPGALAFVGWMSLQPQPAQAEQFCYLSGKRCSVEGQLSEPCLYFGCYGYIGEGYCECVSGHWVCPASPEC